MSNTLGANEIAKFALQKQIAGQNPVIMDKPSIYQSNHR